MPTNDVRDIQDCINKLATCPNPSIASAFLEQRIIELECETLVGSGIAHAMGVIQNLRGAFEQAVRDLA